MELKIPNPWFWKILKPCLWGAFRQVLWQAPSAGSSLPLVDRAAVARCVALVEEMSGAELSAATSLPGTVHGLTALHVAAGTLTDPVLVRAMLQRGARPDARDVQGRTAAQFAREQRRLPQASAAADLIDAAHACTIESGRAVRVTRQALAAGLAVLLDRPDGVPLASSAGVPRTFDAATAFMATGLSSGAWVEVSPPGGQHRGWLRCSDLR